MYVCMYVYIYIYIHIYMFVDVDVDVCGYMYMYVCVYVNVNICIYSFKENLKSKRMVDFSALLPVTGILTSSSQYTGSNTLKLHKVTDLYVKF